MLSMYMYSDSVAAAQYYGALLPCVRVCWCGGANFDDLYTQLQREYQVVSFFFAKVTLYFVMAKCQK